MKKIKLRNPVAKSPLLRKGGVHTLPKRQRLQRLQVQAALLEWECEPQLPITVTNNRLSNDY